MLILNGNPSPFFFSPIEVELEPTLLISLAIVRCLNNNLPIRLHSTDSGNQLQLFAGCRSC